MSLPVAVEIDHALYLRERAYRRQVLISLRRLVRSGRGRVAALSVMHEADASCCAYEPWARTAARIYSALAADGVPVVHAAVDGGEESPS